MVYFQEEHVTAEAQTNYQTSCTHLLKQELRGHLQGGCILRSLPPWLPAEGRKRSGYLSTLHVCSLW